MKKKWQIYEEEQEKINKISIQYHINKLLASILVNIYYYIYNLSEHYRLKILTSLFILIFNFTLILNYKNADFKTI